jgi:hypothetical protein
MKKLYFLFAPFILFLLSCGKFHDTGTSVWSEGLWILPWLTGLGAAFFGYKTYKAATSGSIITHADGTTEESDENVPFYKTGWFYFAAGLLVATIAIILSVNGDK